MIIRLTCNAQVIDAPSRPARVGTWGCPLNAARKALFGFPKTAWHVAPGDGDGTWQAVANYQASNQPSSENFQNVGRPVALGSLFGAVMLLALATGMLAAVGRTPRMLAFVVILLWLAAGLVLVIGAGVPAA